MKKYSKQEKIYAVNFFLMLNLGLIATAIGITFFKSPNNFAFGGTSGISIIISNVLPKINVGMAMWFVNIALVILGIIFLDRKKIGWTVFSSLALSFYVMILEKLIPIKDSFSGDLFIDFCFSVILPAIGSAIVFNIGASTGGTDIVAMILNKHTSLKIGKALMLSDLGIVLIAACLFGPKKGLYCILGLALKSTVVDTAIEGLNLKKVCTVVCENPEEIKEYIIKELHRGATEQKAYGAYTHEKRAVIMTVLSRHEATLLRNYIKDTDKHAFITIVNSSEIIGKGFRSV